MRFLLMVSAAHAPGCIHSFAVSICLKKRGKCSKSGEVTRKRHRVSVRDQGERGAYAHARHNYGHAGFTVEKNLWVELIK